MKKAIFAATSAIALVLSACETSPSANMASDGSLLSAQLNPKTAALLEGIEVKYDRFTLDNGLNVLVHSDHSAPTVFVGVWYGVGSKDEPEGKTGFAHLFEHLMFKQTANRKVDFMTALEDVGVSGLNGTTSKDRTNYFVNVPTGALDLALWLESDRMAYLLGGIDQAKLDDERAVVKNEKRQGENRPYADMSGYIDKAIYPIGHPYRHSVIGSMDDINAASLADVEDWFTKFYGASNATLILSGDITLEDAKKKAAKYFADAPAGEPIARDDTWMPALGENKFETVQGRVPQSVLTRVWVTPPGGEKEASLLTFAAQLLADPTTSSLHKRLVEEQGLATNIQVLNNAMDLSGVFIIGVGVTPGEDPDEVGRVLDEELAKVFNNGFDAEVVENSQFAMAFSTAEILEQPSVIGRMLGENNQLTGDPAFIEKELAWRLEASPEKLIKTMEHWLSKPFYQLTYEKFEAKPIAAEGVDRTEMPEVLRAEGGIDLPDVATRTLKNGMKVVAVKDGKSPILHVSFRMDTGSFAERQGEDGLAGFALASLPNGAGDYSAKEFARELDKIAMTPASSASQKASTLSYRILASEFERSVDLVSQMLRTPLVDQEKLDQMKEGALVSINSRDSAPEGGAGAFMNRLIFGDDHFTGRLSSAAAVESITRDRIKAFLAREISPSAMTVYIGGNIEMDEIESVLQDAFAGWNASSDTALKEIGDAQKASPRIVLIDKPGAPQSVIRAGHALGRYDQASADVIEIANKVYGGGFASRINQNLRAEKGWSYGVRSNVNQNLSGDQTFVISTSVQTDKTAQSVRELTKELEAYVTDRPATEEEVSKVVESAIGSQPGEYSLMRHKMMNLQVMDHYGLPYDYPESLKDRLSALSAGDVAQAARENFRPDALNWVIVGDLDKIEAEIRALGLGEVEVWDANGLRLR